MYKSSSSKKKDSEKSVKITIYLARQPKVLGTQDDFQTEEVKNFFPTNRKK